MARTLIGELLLRMKDDTHSDQVADKVAGSMRRIEEATKRLNAAPWGGKFQSQLDKLKVSAGDLDTLERSWKRLHESMAGRDISKALAKNEIANWKTSVLGQFAQAQQNVRDELDKTKRHATSWRNSMNAIFKSGLVALGAYTGAYMGGVAIKGGLMGSAEWEREKFRGVMAGISPKDRQALIARSVQLGQKYPSISIAEISELGRTSIGLTGNPKDGLDVLEDLVRGQVALQTAQGTDVGAETLRTLLRGIDNLGQNSGGPQGLKQTREIIAGMIRAAQVEGYDFDPGKLFEFARRAKGAGPGFSTDFLAMVAPAIIQDMGASGAGTSFGSAFANFVTASNATNNKQTLANQMALGIRSQDGVLSESALFQQNPFEWTQKVLIPALQKSGVNLEDDNEVQAKVSGLSRNQMVQYAMTRMVTQRGQIQRNIDLYGKAIGPDQAGIIPSQDPFVAWKGMITSLTNLAAALGEDTMPTIVAGLNSLTGAINGMGEAWRNGDAMTKGLIGAGAVAGGAGIWKIMSGIWGLATAGPALNAAALSLEGAAVSLAAAGGGPIPGVGGKKGWGGGKWGWGALLRSPYAVAAGAIGGVHSLFDPGEGLVNAPRKYGAWGVDDLIRYLMGTGGGKQKEAPAIGQSFAGQEKMTAGIVQAGDIATMMGGKISDALSPTAKPVVDTTSIDAAQAKADKLVNTLRQAGDVQTMMGGSINGTNPSRQLNRTMSDMGVQP